MKYQTLNSAGKTSKTIDFGIDFGFFDGETIRYI